MAKKVKTPKKVSKRVQIVKTNDGAYGLGLIGEEITIQRANALIKEHNLKSTGKPDSKPGKTIYTYE